MVWSALIEEGIDAVFDVTGGRYAPSGFDMAGGSPPTFPPDRYDPEPREREKRRPRQEHQDEPRREPTNKERKLQMKEGILINAILGTLGNLFGAVSAPAALVPTGADAGIALGTGINEIAKNEGRGFGGSSNSGREIWEAIEAEHRTEPWPRRKK